MSLIFAIALDGKCVMRARSGLSALGPTQATRCAILHDRPTWKPASPDMGQECILEDASDGKTGRILGPLRKSAQKRGDKLIGPGKAIRALCA